MTIKPWYKVIYPRQDLRDNKPLDASEFAVHLDQVRDGRAPGDYQEPRRFFERTFLTQNLIDLSAQVVRRLSGERTGTSAIFNLSTQFGGGKTHALTLLYHLAKNGSQAEKWLGVERIQQKAEICSIPESAVAVFVGTEFDSLTGRGGSDGTPHRRTPWGEIAYQLGGEQSLAVLAEHESQFIEPKGDVIRAFLPKDRPCLILLDEIINYVSTYRSLGYHNRLYNFIQALSETARGMDNVVLVVSIPASELEYTPEDEADEQRFKKMLDRLGKAIMMSAESETAEIIRRRLFEWDSQYISQDGHVMLSQDAQDTCREYADWVLDHRTQLPSWFPVDHAFDTYKASYPFHPSVLSVFERKWQALPRFQRTRGVLRLLALWVARAYQEGYKGAQRDALLGLGTAPLDDSNFRAAVFEQLGENRLEAAVTSDICGKKDSFATRLDEQAIEAIRKSRLHRKASTSIFFESNGGQSSGETTVPEIRLAVSEPDLDIGNVETVLESLRSNCYYLEVRGNHYRFSTTPNLNKILGDRRATVQDSKITERVNTEVQTVFTGGSGVDRIYFPETSNQVYDRAALTLAILSPEHCMSDSSTSPLIEKITKECGTSGRTFKSALLWAVADADTQLRDDARQLLAWEVIQSEFIEGQLRLDESQQRELKENLGKAKRDLKESVWRAYRNLVLLSKENELRTINLGLVHSSAADSMVSLILNRLRQDGEIEDQISPAFLVRNWPAFTEWSTKSARDAFFASPKFPRLTNPDAVKQTIKRGVQEGLLGYVSKTSIGKYDLFYYKTTLDERDIEIKDDVYLITGQTAEEYLKRIRDGARVTRLEITPTEISLLPNSRKTFSIQCYDQNDAPIKPSLILWSASGGEIDTQGNFTAGSDIGSYQVEAKVGEITAIATVSVVKGKDVINPPDPKPDPDPNPKPPLKKTYLIWNGLVPAQKWMNFYTKILTKFALGHDLELTVQVKVRQPNGISDQKIEETKSAIQELGLKGEVEVS